MTNYSPPPAPHQAGTPTKPDSSADGARSTGWSDERRARHAELIRRLAPWTKSTGPRTAEGKARAAANLGLTIPAPAAGRTTKDDLAAAGNLTKPHRAAPAAERISMIDTVRAMFASTKTRRERQRDDLLAKIAATEREHRDAVAAADDAAADRAWRKRCSIKGELEAVEVAIAETARLDAREAQRDAEAAAEDRRQEAVQTRADYQRAAIEFEAHVHSLAPRWQAVLDLANIAMAKERAAGLVYMQPRRQLPGAVWPRLWLGFLSQLRGVGDGKWTLPEHAPKTTHESVAEFIARDTAAAAVPRRINQEA